MKATRATGRVTKGDWLDKALEVFVSGGIEAVKIADLARRLDISKSGFYWHFRDRPDLLEAMKLYWVDEFSRQFMDDTITLDSSPRDRLIALIRAIRSKESGKLDLAFTSWAQVDPDVKILVDQVRDLRIAFVKGLLSETGLSDADITSRARIFVVYVSWSEVMFEYDNNHVIGEDLERVLDTIVNG